MGGREGEREGGGRRVGMTRKRELKERVGVHVIIVLNKIVAIDTLLADTTDKHCTLFTMDLGQP